jgi:O-antigen/teichoic acid export membrane protein
MEATTSTWIFDAPDGGFGHKSMSGISTSHQLTSGRLLARNTMWNLAGQILPMVAGIVTIPAIIRGIGVERFGVLSLAWAVVGYFSLFDLGIGRALTKLIAERLGANDAKSIIPLVRTSLFLMFALGIFGAVITLIASKAIVYRLLKIPQALQTETLQSFYLLALSIPVVTFTAGFRGILEAFQRFRVLNLIRVPASIFSFVGPLAVIPFSHRLVPVIVVLLAGRLVGCGAQMWACRRAIDLSWSNSLFDTSAVVTLLRFGGWMTVTNIVGPLMVTLDRFIIAALLSVSAVAYYAIPFDTVTKLWFIPTALLGVIFPALSMTSVQDRGRTAVLYARSVKFLLVSLFPIILFVIVMAQNGLELWLGRDFADHGTRVLQWLAAGVFINCLAQAPFSLIQGVGRPDLTAKLHLIELPMYLIALWWLTRTHGIEGAAIAWTIRVSIDALALFIMSRRFLPHGHYGNSQTGVALVSSLIVLCFAGQVQDLVFKSVFLLLTVLAFLLLTWFVVFSPEERRFARAFL